MNRNILDLPIEDIIYNQKYSKISYKWDHLDSDSKIKLLLKLNYYTSRTDFFEVNIDDLYNFYYDHDLNFFERNMSYKLKAVRSEWDNLNYDEKENLVLKFNNYENLNEFIDENFDYLYDEYFDIDNSSAEWVYLQGCKVMHIDEFKKEIQRLVSLECNKQIVQDTLKKKNITDPFEMSIEELVEFHCYINDITL